MSINNAQILFLRDAINYRNVENVQQPRLSQEKQPTL